MYLYAIEQYKKDNLVEITHYFFEKEDQLDYLKKNTSSKIFTYRGITINPFADSLVKPEVVPYHFEKESNDIMRCFLEFKKHIKLEYQFLAVHLFLKMNSNILSEDMIKKIVLY